MRSWSVTCAGLLSTLPSKGGKLSNHLYRDPYRLKGVELGRGVVSDVSLAISTSTKRNCVSVMCGGSEGGDEWGSEGGGEWEVREVVSGK